MNSLGNKKIMADNIKKYMDISSYIPSKLTSHKY